MPIVPGEVQKSKCSRSCQKNTLRHFLPSPMSHNVTYHININYTLNLIIKYGWRDRGISSNMKHRRHNLQAVAYSNEHGFLAKSLSGSPPPLHQICSETDATMLCHVMASPGTVPVEDKSSCPGAQVPLLVVIVFFHRSLAHKPTADQPFSLPIYS